MCWRILCNVNWITSTSWCLHSEYYTTAVNVTYWKNDNLHFIFISSFVAEMFHKIEGLQFISRQGRNFLPGHNIPTGLGANLTSCNDTNFNNMCFIFTSLHGVVLITTILYFTFDCQTHITIRNTLLFTIKSLITPLLQTVTE